MTIDNERLNKLKQFIIDKYEEESKNPIITLQYRIEVPIKSIIEIFNAEFVSSIQQLRTWLHEEFPNKTIKVYLEDRLHTDIYIEIH